MQTPDCFVGRSRNYRRALTIVALAFAPGIILYKTARALARMSYVLVTGEVPSF
jgi:hypothetical protein